MIVQYDKTEGSSGRSCVRMEDRYTCSATIVDKLCIDQPWVYQTKVYWCCPSNILASSPWTRYCNERPWDSSAPPPACLLILTSHHCACDDIPSSFSASVGYQNLESGEGLRTKLGIVSLLTHIPRLLLCVYNVINQGLEQGEQLLRWHFSPPYLVMWTFYAKQVVLQIAPTLCQFQELLVINYGAVKVRHNCAGEICSSCC